ncbi:ADP-ribosyltransferase [Cohnella thailandensis]|uniref:Minor capsid protein n=1 Tax=Cohnella thailandensis TaxID=557557 RepID=A0A841SNL0_9BACL|nr:ADP-ribosyltransferase [Cohnella thailandensis]MBB6632772.1 minor capsid protein [Cohnella thailandensis]MBP1975538.1 SPP1 gp7 family putative phage head morphogenesis protein [Cohnella thailandensis]
MKPADYWQRRSEEVAARQFAKADAYDATMQREYARAAEEIQRAIEVFYQRYAENGEVSFAEARRQLSGRELGQFKLTLEEFIEKAKDNADGRWTKQLNEAYYRVRVSRYEALMTEVRQSVELLAGKRQAGTGELLGDVYTDTYYRTIFELQKGIGIGATFAKIDQEGLQTVLGTEFAGSNWSKRIWGYRDKLVTELRTKLAQAFIRGESAEKTIQDVSARMDVSYSNAERLVQTESAFFAGQATMAGYKASNVVDDYELLATLDNKTSETCRAMDGKVFKLSEMEVGVNYPPLHARCRTTTVPFFEDEIDPGERIARGEDGMTYTVPGNMTYEDWYEKYVSSTDSPKSGIIDQIEYRSFGNAKEVKDWEAKVTPKWLESLTEEEEQAIRRYTGSSYREINQNLRQAEGDEQLDRIAELISSGIRKFNLTENITAYRGLSQNIFGAPAADLPGVEFTDAAFWSTTLLSDRQFSGMIQMEIHVPAGTKGAMINPLSSFKDSEYEFLLDKGMLYRIESAEEENGKINLIVEVLGYADR